MLPAHSLTVFCNDERPHVEVGVGFMGNFTRIQRGSPQTRFAHYVLILTGKMIELDWGGIEWQMIV